MTLEFDDHPELAALYARYNPGDSSCRGLYINSGRCWWLGKGELGPPAGRRLWSIYERAGDGKIPRSDTFKEILIFIKKNYPEELI